MILVPLLLLMQSAYPPETEAVQGRTRPAPRRAASASQSARGLSVYLPPEVAMKLQTCTDEAIDDPAKGVRFAEDWAKDGGGFSADQCRGFALSRAERWDEAAGAFDAGALAAQKAGSAADAARLWAQAGNAALAGGNAVSARNYFDRALAGGLPEGLAKGETHLDRARALVALGDGKGARIDLDAATRLAKDDPLAWLLSATLARREKDRTRAAHDIAEAGRLAPDDPAVLLEQGNIAISAGDEAGAKAAWEKLLRIAPDSAPAASARSNLAQIGQGGAAAPSDQSR